MVPVSRLKRSSTLRSSISTGGLHASGRLLGADATYEVGQTIGGARIHDPLLTCCPPSEEKKRVRIPQLSLKGKDDPKGSSRILSSSAVVPSVTTKPIYDNPVREAEPSRYPPCPWDKEEKLVLERAEISLKPQAHSLHQYDLSFNAVSPAISSLGSKVKCAMVQSPQVASRSTGCSLKEHLEQELTPGAQHNPDSNGSGSVHDPKIHSQNHSADSNELSRALLSRNDVKAPAQLQISEFENETSVAEMSLCEPHHLATIEEIHSIVPSSKVRSTISHSSLRSNVHTPSLLTSASRNSAYRHVLLKPSVTALQPIDLGLPVQPILTAAPNVVSLVINLDNLTEATTGFCHIASRATLVGALTAILHSKPTQDTAETNKSPVLTSDGQNNTAVSSSLRNKSNSADCPEDLTDRTFAKVAGPSQHSAKVKAPLPNLDKFEASPPENGAWGFVPVAKGAVEDVVQDGVRQAIQNGIRPPGIKLDQASGVYQRIVAESLVEAAWTADEYLKRTSLRDDQLPSSHGNTGTSQARNGEHPECSETDLKPTSGSLSTQLAAQLRLRTSISENSEIPQTYSPSQYSLEPRSRASIAEPHDVAGGVLACFKSYENLTPREAPGVKAITLEEDLNCIDPKKGSLKIAMQEHSIPGKSSPRYTTIPTRKSSLDQEKSRRKNTGDHPASTRSSISASRNHLIEHLVANGSPKLPSNSSMSSIKTSPPLPSKPGPSNIDEHGSKLRGTLDNQPSAPWLRDLLSDGGSCSTRLTALPPRTHRKANNALRPVRSLTPLSCAMASLEPGHKRAEPRASETFSRTINDLELLLNEALHIARQAVEREDGDHLPTILNDAAVVMQCGREDFGKDPLKRITDKEAIFRPVVQSQLSDSASLGSVHESARSVSDDSRCYGSGVSMDEYRESYEHPPSELCRPSGAHLVVMQPEIILRKLPTWPVGHGSTAYAPPLMTDLASTAVGLPQDIGNVKVPGNVATHEAKPSAAKTLFAISGVPEFPEIRNGNADPTHVPPSEADDRFEPFVGQHLRQEPDCVYVAIPPRKATVVQQSYEEDDVHRIRTNRLLSTIPNKREVYEFIRVFHEPPIQSRQSSLALRMASKRESSPPAVTSPVDYTLNRFSLKSGSLSSHQRSPRQSVNSLQITESEVDFSTPQGFRRYASTARGANDVEDYELKDSTQGDDNLPKRHISGRRMHDKLHHLKHDKLAHLNLKGKSHVSLRGHSAFSMSRSHHRQPIARDWSPGRKRFVASVACISTALIGILIGIYAGEVPSIQYYIADLSHYSILGNVFFFIGLAVSTLLFWPLPLLHGRKPYVLTAMTIAMPLLFPQAISVSLQRSPYVATYRVGLILPRAFMGVALGFANMNFMATLTDLFGASLQSGNPHQETVDKYDARRHGGGMGVWLGIWTWCYMGSIGVGFLIGALVINNLSPDWGFYVSIVIMAAVLLLNVITPEVRRSAYRRSIAEVRNPTEISRRLARGEVMMHRLQTGPKWWGQEFHHGVMLSLDMMHQPGLLIMSFYVAWIYGQIVLVIVLISSLMSKYYRFTSPVVGLTTMAIPLGALLAIPFQKASLFSRARHHAQRTDSGTFDRKISWSSHLIRRAIFTLFLPLAGLAYTLSSSGPPTPFILPVLFAGLIAFLSNLAIAECNGIIMETFDTSDLQPGMTGRPRGASGERTKHKRTNYSSFPRVSSAFAIIQSLGFLIGAVATGVGGVAERQLGQMTATGIMTGILLVLTVGVLGVLMRWKDVQIIPGNRTEDMKKWEREQKMSVQRQEEAMRQGSSDIQVRPEEDEPWRPVIIGNPSGKTRRMSILELGHLSRWSEIRRKNRLVDETAYEARHPNLATLDDVRKEIRDKNLGGLTRGGSRRSKRSQLSQGSGEVKVN